MLYGQDRNELREFYFKVWEKAQANRPLEPLERMVYEVIRLHPEYHGMFNAGADTFADRDYLPELGQVNPFLHMGLHVAIQEQLAADRPPGVRAAYRHIVTAFPDAHAADHHAMDCLAETLWEAQRDGREPDQAAYLRRLRRLTG